MLRTQQPTILPRSRKKNRLRRYSTVFVEVIDQVARAVATRLLQAVLTIRIAPPSLLLMSHNLLLHRFPSHVLNLLKLINEDYSDEISTAQELWCYQHSWVSFVHPGVKLTKEIINHERIHTRQMLEMLILPFLFMVCHRMAYTPTNDRPCLHEPLLWTGSIWEYEQP